MYIEKRVKISEKVTAKALGLKKGLFYTGAVYVDYSPGDCRKKSYVGETSASIVRHLNTALKCIRNNGLSPEVVMVDLTADCLEEIAEELVQESDLECEADLWVQPPGIGHNFNESLLANLSWEEKLQYGVPMTFADKVEAVRAGIESHPTWMQVGAAC